MEIADKELNGCLDEDQLKEADHILTRFNKNKRSDFDKLVQ